MREQEVRELYEAYLQVHQVQEEVEQLDENVQDAVKGALEKGANFMKTNPVGKAVCWNYCPGGGRKTPTATSGGYRKEEN
jgi:DhnA family fructose-bisphosphate aldolase class Ia